MRDRRLGFLLISPMLLMLLAVTLFPTLYAYYLSLYDVTILTFENPPFVGLENFFRVAASSEFWYTLRFTALYAFIVTPVEMVLGFLLALLFDRAFKGKRLLLTLILTPLAVAPALFGIMIRLMLDQTSGSIPYILRLLGIRYYFFRDFTSSFTTLIFTDIVEWTPFVFIIIYAAMQALPQEPFEAGLIDGASKLQMIRYIMIPLLKPALVVVLIFRLMDAFKTFDTIYVMTGGGPGFSTTTVSIYIYKQGFLFGRFGQAAAATIFLFYLTIAAAMIGIWLLRRYGGV